MDDDALGQPSEDRGREEERPFFAHAEFFDDVEEDESHQRVGDPRAEPVFERIVGTDARPEEMLRKVNEDVASAEDERELFEGSHERNTGGMGKVAKYTPS